MIVPSKRIVCTLLALVGCSTDEHMYAVAFVTSSVHTARFDGLAGADAVCTERAADAGLDGTFVAWLSTSSTSAFSRVQSGQGWVLVNGAPVATTPSELVTGAVLAPIALDERGRDTRGVLDQVWTGTGSDGTASNSSTCADWTVDDMSATGLVGTTRAGGTRFTEFAYDSRCASPRRLYCFETNRRSAVTVTPSGRVAFVSSAVWSVNPAGVASADQVCQSEASAAGLAGTYLALLSTTTASASARFDVSGAPWSNTAGVPLAGTAERLFTATYLDGTLNRFADGSVAPHGTVAWGGDPMSVAPLSSCVSWTDATYVESPAVGRVHHTDRDERYRAVYEYPTCASSHAHLYCLQI